MQTMTGPVKSCESQLIPVKTNSTSSGSGGCPQQMVQMFHQEPVIQSEVSRKGKHQYSILMHTYGIKLFLSVDDIYVEYPMKPTATE